MSHRDAEARPGARTIAAGFLRGFRAATAYVDRDGTIVRAIDPVKCAAWSQGDVRSPSTKIPTIAAAVASEVNMNEWVHEASARAPAPSRPPAPSSRASASSSPRHRG